MQQPTSPLIAADLAGLQRLVAVGDGAPELAERLELAQVYRGRSRERSRQLDQFLIDTVLDRGTALNEARCALQRLKELLETLRAPPWHPAIFVGFVEGEASRALVAHGGAQRVVQVAEAVDPAALGSGDEVYLTSQLNVLVGRSPLGPPPYGETALFERRTADGRLVLRSRDEEVVVRAATVLREAELRRGEQVRWDRAAWLAFERLERSEGLQFLLEDVPDISADQIGGQDRAVRAVLAALTASLIAPETAARYALGVNHSVLLYGPPGCGKTLIAKLAAAEVMRRSGRRCRIAVVKPAAWESPWVGETQANIRACFAALRAATAHGDYALLFLDEVEAVGRIRGSGAGHHSDKFLAAFLDELQGFTDRSGIAIVSASNRKDLVDPALLQRLSDVEVHVKAPDMRGARAIFDIHLPTMLPYSPNGTAAAETRCALIDTAVAQFYSPNADNTLCVLRFRNGSTRIVAARELASGRTFEQICRAARRSAYWREVSGGEAGLRVSDIADAVADAMTRLATTLTARNVHAYLSDLPDDFDVVSVDPVRRTVRHPDRYLNQ